MIRCRRCSAELDELNAVRHACFTGNVSAQPGPAEASRPRQPAVMVASALKPRAAAVFDAGGRSGAEEIGQRPPLADHAMSVCQVAVCLRKAARVLREDLRAMSPEQKGLVAVHIWRLLEDDERTGTRKDRGLAEPIGALLGMTGGAVRVARFRALQALGAGEAAAQGKLLLDVVYIHVRAALGATGASTIARAGDDLGEALSTMDTD